MHHEFTLTLSSIIITSSSTFPSSRPFYLISISLFLPVRYFVFQKPCDCSQKMFKDEVYVLSTNNSKRALKIEVNSAAQVFINDHQNTKGEAKC